MLTYVQDQTQSRTTQCVNRVEWKQTLILSFNGEFCMQVRTVNNYGH